MKRRDAIKGLGMSLGLLVATPSAMSLLHSCKSDPKVGWQPEFFSPEEGTAIKSLVGLILPSTDALPGAIDVNVPEFIDKYAALVASNEEQENFRKSMEAIAEAIGKPVSKATDNDYDALLSKFLKATPEQMEAFQNNENEKQVFEALMGLRGISIWGYTNSQKVGTELLAYDPVPGTYQGCISLEEATGGKAWSL
ncbi:MAG: gluconate 2-dehydrogenase subunit 3 family protein [Flavobacteriaceae bacterium]|nr:gluconate 2-dehydrogenase subunit 3 family protein [Flavobacteriaceae bacterium]